MLISAICRDLSFSVFSDLVKKNSFVLKGLATVFVPGKPFLPSVMKL
jgi:hypothetical protein